MLPVTMVFTNPNNTERYAHQVRLSIGRQHMT